MKKKYYYDCLIQALYMTREFDVKFFTKGHLNIESDFLEMELGYHLNIRDIYGKLANDHTKIYVASESEHIFEPKKGDEGRWARKIGAHYANYNGEQWVSAGIEEKLPDIIYRNGKHFFNPKEEN